jgi:hypothetical protein
MSDHPLDGFQAEDEHHSGERSVSFDGEILSVHFFRPDHGDFTYASVQRYFRLTEVQQVWTEVEPS